MLSDKMNKTPKLYSVIYEMVRKVIGNADKGT